MGIGDWGLGIGPNPQSPIPNPQIILLVIFEIVYLILNTYYIYYYNLFYILNTLYQ